MTRLWLVISTLLIVAGGVTFLVVRFGNPEMTDAQVVVRYWREYVVGIWLVFCGCLVLVFKVR